jgi:hypothetical protein
MSIRQNKKGILISLILIFIFLVSACQSKVPTAINNEITSKTSPTKVQSTPTEIIHTPTLTPEIINTPTPDTRIPPEQWESWPILPVVTNRAIEIFKNGQASGVNPNAFSKIGDCQNVKESFMGIYDTGRYFLQDWQKDWQQTIDQFKGYYNRDSLAFGQGLNVAAALSPLHADPSSCEPDENPVQCELRVINPAFAFIRFERWYPDVTPPETYEKYLRQIIDLVIDNGTVPILMTKADNIEGNQQINKIISKLAYEYDIPIYNWWRAAQALPNRGLDPERDDKFHIDPKYAWIEQSAFGLGSLDSIWKGTRGY